MLYSSDEAMSLTVPHMKAFCANPVIFPQSSILTISVATFNNFTGMHIISVYCNYSALGTFYKSAAANNVAKTLNAALPVMQYLSHIYTLDLLCHHITVIG
jgi:hypothetical protein